MELPEIGPAILVLAGVFLLGLGIGMFARRGAGAARRRAASLEADLRAAQMQLREVHIQLAGHKNSVAKHFEQTSDLFRELTRQYTSLYAHLAEGARDLCPGAWIPLGHGFDGTPLEPPAAPPDAEVHEPAQPEESSPAPPTEGERLTA